MKWKEHGPEVQAESTSSVLYERYRYGPGGPWPGPAEHIHEEYQLGLSVDTVGAYRYRGAIHRIPVGALSIVHPGEAHRTRDVEEFRAPTTYRIAYVDASLFREAATELSGPRSSGEPFFPGTAVRDRELAGRFLHLFESIWRSDTELESGSRLISLLTKVISRHSEGRPKLRPAGREHAAVSLAKDYLRDNLTENASLGELAELCGLSQYHLLRVFSAEVGLPPHAYQVRARVDLAKRLLIRGLSPSRAARESGFYDHSHLIRHFKRFVGTTPGMYAREQQEHTKQQ